MKIRCDLHINHGHRKLILAPQPQETLEHLALKLAAYLLFWAYDPKVELSPKHPALAQQEFRPDLIALDEAGEVRLWVECGNVTLHKLDKLIRRYPAARLCVLKATEAEGKRLRNDLREQVPRQERVEVLCWPGPFSLWSRALEEKTHAVGETSETSLNLVMNETAVAVDLVRA